MANGNRLKWLRVRAEYIHEMAAEGRQFAEIAQTLSCDPGQAQLIAMTPLDTLHPSVSDSAIAAAAELRGREWLPRAQEAARRVERLYHHPSGDEHMGNAIAGLLLALGLEG